MKSLSLIHIYGVKMPKLAMPLRILLAGQEQTPSVDALLALFPREIVLKRLAVGMQADVLRGSAH